MDKVFLIREIDPVGRSPIPKVAGYVIARTREEVLASARLADHRPNNLIYRAEELPRLGEPPEVLRDLGPIQHR